MKNKAPKTQEGGYIRNAIIYLIATVLCFFLKLWIFGLLSLLITAFYVFMAYKHFGQPTAMSSFKKGVHDFFNEDYDSEESDFGNIETDNKAYNAQKRWNELERERKMRLSGEAAKETKSEDLDFSEELEYYGEEDYYEEN